MPPSDRGRAVFLTTLALLILSTPAAAVVRTVALDGSADYTIIQEAVEASTAGDSVLVHPGTYTWTNQNTDSDFALVTYWLSERDEVDLVSVGGAEVTILDAESQGRAFFANGSSSQTNRVNFMIEGFTFRNGLAPLPPGPAPGDPHSGGGVALHLCDVVFQDCNFEDNVADLGGGVWAVGGRYEFYNCRFTDNRAIWLPPEAEGAPHGGGAMVFGAVLDEYDYAAVFSGCTFIGNHSDYRGGGLFTAQDDVLIEDCLFAENTCAPGTKRAGTAIYALNPHDMRVNGVTVRDHVSAPGASVHVADFDYDDNGQTVNIYTRAQIHDTNISVGTGTGLNLTVVEINEFDVSCTNLYGGFPGDWLGAELLPYKSIQGNMTVDPLFCSAWGDRRAVGENSPLLAANNSCGTDIGRIVGRSCETVRVEDPGSTPPMVARGTRLIGAAPNPFNPRTSIGFELEESAQVKLDVYDARGRHVATVFDGPKGPGLHEETFDGRALGSGVYRLRLQAGDQVRTGSMVLVR